MGTSNTRPGGTGGALTPSGQEIVQNKDIDGGVATDARRITVPQETKANLDALTRKAGTTVYATDLKKYFYDNGTELVEAGTAGAGEINYITNFDLEINTANYSPYADAAAATPVDGTGDVGGGSPFITFVRTTTASEIIRDTASGKISKDASDRQGEGTSNDFTIDAADKNKLLKFEIEYFTSANYADGDVALYIYDIDNATLITPTSASSGSDNTVPASATATTVNRHSVAWASTDSVNYRAIWHITSTNALAWDFIFDNVIVGPGLILTTPIITGWELVTVDGSWVTNTTYVAYRRRVGDTAEYLIDVNTSGIPTSAVLTVNIEAGLTINTGILNDGGDPLGTLIVDNNGIREYPGVVRRNDSTKVSVSIFQEEDETNDRSRLSTISEVNPINFSNLDQVRMRFSVPILEWVDQGTTNAIVQDNLSEWRDFTPIFASGGNLLTTIIAKYRRVGDSMEMQFCGDYTGASTDTGLKVEIPGGFTLATNFVRCQVGSAEFFDDSATEHFPLATDARTSSNSAGPLYGYPGGLPTIAINDNVSFNVTIPIVEFAGTQNSLVGFSEATATTIGLMPFYSEINGDFDKAGGYDATEITNFGDSTFKIFGTRVGKIFTLGVLADFDITTGNDFDTVTVPWADLPFMDGLTPSVIAGSFWTNVNGATKTVGGDIAGDSTNLTFCFIGDFEVNTNRVIRGTVVVVID